METPEFSRWYRKVTFQDKLTDLINKHEDKSKRKIIRIEIVRVRDNGECIHTQIYYDG